MEVTMEVVPWFRSDAQPLPFALCLVCFLLVITMPS